MILPIFFAQESASFTNGQLGTALGICAFLLGIAIAAKKLFGHEPPLHKEYATKEDHGALAKRLDEELGRERGARKRMHEEIGALQGDVKAIITETENQSTTLDELKVDSKSTAREVASMGGELKGINTQLTQIALTLQSQAKK